jgi:hypothetical protein
MIAYLQGKKLPFDLHINKTNKIKLILIFQLTVLNYCMFQKEIPGFLYSRHFVAF